MSAPKIDYSEYDETNVSGSVRALAACFNAAASLNYAKTPEDIVESGYALFEKVSGSANSKSPLSLSQDDETYLRLSFLDAATKITDSSPGFRPVSPLENLAVTSAAIFDEAVKKKIIRPAPDDML